DRICRRYLIDLVRVGGNGGPRRPEEVFARDLHLTVEESAGGRVRLRLDGTARLATHDAGSGARGKQPKVDTVQLLGCAGYEGGKGAGRRSDAIASSETGPSDEIHNRVLPFGVAFELTAGETPADRLPPSSYAKGYFGKGR